MWVVSSSENGGSPSELLDAKNFMENPDLKWMIMDDN